MKKNHTIQSARGFTLIEVMLAVIIIGFLGGTALMASLNLYKGYQLRADTQLVVALLLKARTMAVNNIYDAPHGLYVTSTAYILFTGTSYASRTSSHDHVVAISPALTRGGISEVVFAQLTGAASASGSLTLANEQHEKNILINYQGRVVWQ